MGEKQGVLVSTQEIMFQTEVKGVLLQIQEELDDHRLSINENTADVEALFEYIKAVEAKVDRIIQFLESKNTVQKPEASAAIAVKPLNSAEKRVFQALYAVTQASSWASYKDIAAKAGMAPDTIASYVARLLEKGVPIVKKFQDKTAYVGIKEDFRQLQAKTNILGISSLLAFI